MRKTISMIIALILAVCVFSGCSGNNAKTTRAVIPDESYGGTVKQFLEGKGFSNWMNSRREYLDVSRELQPELVPFYGNLMGELLSASDENTVCSPVNVYMALTMLAEAASGQTRQQILDVLGTSDIEKLRSNANNIWRANYSDNPLIKCQLANSLWMRDDLSYNETLFKILAEYHHADMFVGEFGSDAMNKELASWTDDHTGGLLKDYTKDMKLDAEGVMELVSAIYFKGTWIEPFMKNATEEQTFHGASGDSQCEMMSQSGPGSYYWGDDFSAIFLNISYGGGMLFFLPDEDSSLKALCTDPQVLDVIKNVYDPEYENTKHLMINKKIPKFSLSSKTDLRTSLKALGITDAFDPKKADFTSLVEGFTDDIWVDKADHAAMVMIDEEGVTGAAYTDLAMAGGAMPPTEVVDFVLDRPFLYTVIGNDGTILFAGTVYDLS